MSVRFDKLFCMLAIPLVLAVACLCGCSSQEAAVRAATEQAIDSLASGEALFCVR